MKTLALVGMYLSAIVLANLSVAYFGPKSVIINAFILIGLDLTCRDALHERWHNHRWLKMAALIGAGSALSWLMNRNVGFIAVASCAAFLSSSAVDTLVYALLKDKSRLVKVNGSNMPSAVVDSVVFLALAFGTPIPWSIVAAQVAAKWVGGYLWSKFLFRESRPTVVA